MKKAMVIWVAISVVIVSVQGCASAHHTGGRGPASVDPSKVKVLGGDESSFQQQPDGNFEVIHDPDSYDAVVVGAGLSGLAAATFLTDAKYSKKVLVLEKENHVGGLASGGLINGESYSRGAAYWTDTYEEEQKILNYIGLAKFQKGTPDSGADRFVLGARKALSRHLVSDDAQESSGKLRALSPRVDPCQRRQSDSEPALRGFRQIRRQDGSR